MSNLTKRHSSEIQEAIDTMDYPNYCRDCGEFVDSYSTECPVCQGDSGMLRTEDMAYYLEMALEDEAQSQADHLLDLKRGA